MTPARITFSTRGFPRCCGTPLRDDPHAAFVCCRKCGVRISYSEEMRDLRRGQPRHSIRRMRRARATSNELATRHLMAETTMRTMTSAIAAWEQKVTEAMS